MDTQRSITVELCMGSACFARGNNRLVSVLRALVEEAGLQNRVHIKGCRCLGMCKNGPVVKINGIPHHNLGEADLAVLLRTMVEEA